MWLTLSNAQIQRLLQGMDHTQETGLVLTSPDSCFVLEKTDNASFLNPELLTVSQQLPSTEEVTVEGKHFQKTVVALEESDLVLISFSSTEHLFGFRHTYLFLLVLFGVVSVLAMCLFAFSVRHLVHKPIRTLVDAFRCMKGNNFDVRIHQKRNDEFAYLYQSFNGMMDHLQKVDRAGIRPAPSDPAGGTQAASVPNQPTFSVQRVLQYLPHGQKKTATMTLPSSPSC